ncbi:MAG: hypothetical protein ACKO0Z_15070 [Betaproteobacteria bacterium]
MKKIEREILALMELRRMFEFGPLTTEELASRLRKRPDEIKHIVWGLWMDDKIKALKVSRGQKRKWILT